MVLGLKINKTHLIGKLIKERIMNILRTSTVLNCFFFEIVFEKFTKEIRTKSVCQFDKWEKSFYVAFGKNLLTIRKK